MFPDPIRRMIDDRCPEEGIIDIRMDSVNEYRGSDMENGYHPRFAVGHLQSSFIELRDADPKVHEQLSAPLPSVPVNGAS
jgi:hypothetical protein